MTTQLKDILCDTSDVVNKNSDLSSVYIPSQAFLTSLIQIFPYLFIHIKHKFSERFVTKNYFLYKITNCRMFSHNFRDFFKLSLVLQNAISVPLMNSDASLPYMMSLSMSEPLTPLQENILFVLETLQKEILVDSELYPLLPSIFNQYLALSYYSVNISESLFQFN